MSTATAARTASSDTVERVTTARRRRTARRAVVVATLLVVVVAAYAASLVYGLTVYSPGEVWAVIRGEDVPGASFTVGRLRLPRATLGLLTGLGFGLAGVTFQTMLRNPLASPDVIGISTAASAAAAVGIVIFGLSGTAVSALAIAASLGVALTIYVLSFKDGVAGIRLVLIGIGMAAMLESVIAYAISRAAQWDLQEASRWLAGSLNGAGWDDVVPVLLALVLLTPLLLGHSRGLWTMQLGDDAASGLGVRVERTRLLVIVAAVGIIAFATAAAGPIAFVAFLSGPIAARLVGPGASLFVPAALVGAALVLVADLVGQYAFDHRYPVGVMTGVLGAPYLVYLIVRTNRAGGSL